LEGLHCANCAAKIERAVGALPFVESANLIFIKHTIKIVVKDGFNGDLETILRDIVHKFESHVVVSERETRTNHTASADGDSLKYKLHRIIFGAFLLATGLILEFLTPIEAWLYYTLFIFGYVLLGYDILWRAVVNIRRGNIFNENFLMSLATIGAVIIGEYAEALAVMLFYQTGEYFQSRAVAKSKRSITELMDIRPDYANVERGGEIIRVEPESVKIGDVITVKPGEKIPLDGDVISGSSMLDTAALTGESIPRNTSPGDAVLSGCVNQSGLLRIKVTKTYGESTVAKIIDLVENAASKKAPTEKFITKFAKYYTPIVVALAFVIVLIPTIFHGYFEEAFADSLRRGLIFLVISCPCALVLSIPLSFFGGIGGASRKGILIKGGNYLEALANVDIAAFDKTGTLTKGIFKVTNIYPAENFTKEGLLEAAAFAEAFSTHPIALSIMREHHKPIDNGKLLEYEEIAGKGVSVLASGRRIYAGNAVLMASVGVAVFENQDIGSKVHVAVDGVYAGCIVISDELKEDSKAAIAELKSLGIRKVVMLSGDNRTIAEKVAAEAGVDEVYAELLPGDKVTKLEELNRQKVSKKKLIFVGDGINDAPVLAMADVGIAMGGLGSDAAIEAADVALMTDQPHKLADAIRIARYTKRIVWQNIALALGVKGIFMFLGAFNIAGIGIWEAVFADVGVALIAVINAARVINYKSK